MIIAFANEKGGVGKTTLALHAATWLAKRGRRVVLVDLDTQGSMAKFLAMPDKNDVAQLLRATLYLDPERRPPTASFLAPYPHDGYGNLVVLRGYTETREIEADLFRLTAAGSPGRIVREALEPLLRVGAYVVIDTGPYAGKIQEAVLDVADHVFVPGIPEGLTEAGIIKIAETLKSLGRTITGLIPNRINTSSAKHRETIQSWRTAHTLGPLVYYEPNRGLVGLTNRVVWSEIYRAGKVAWDVRPQEISVSSQDLDRAAGEMMRIMARMAYDIGMEKTW